MARDNHRQICLPALSLATDPGNTVKASSSPRYRMCPVSRLAYQPRRSLLKQQCTISQTSQAKVKSESGQFKVWLNSTRPTSRPERQVRLRAHKWHLQDRCIITMACLAPHEWSQLLLQMLCFHSQEALHRRRQTRSAMHLSQRPQSRNRSPRPPR